MESPNAISSANILKTLNKSRKSAGGDNLPGRNPPHGGLLLATNPLRISFSDFLWETLRVFGPFVPFGKSRRTWHASKVFTCPRDKITRIRKQYRTPRKALPRLMFYTWICELRPDSQTRPTTGDCYLSSRYLTNKSQKCRISDRGARIALVTYPVGI